MNVNTVVLILSTLQVFRSKYGTYPEYHTSADNISVVSEEGFDGSFRIFKSIIDALELGVIPCSCSLGEPFSSYDLYASTDSLAIYQKMLTID